MRLVVVLLAIGEPCSDMARDSFDENEIELASRVGRQDRNKKPNSI
jgi:hypothetical protein